MKILFIGGTGIISSACSQLLLENGAESFDLYLLNRGSTTYRQLPSTSRQPILLTGDIRDPQSARAAIGDLNFDVVVNWIIFSPQQLQADLDLFRGRCKQYVFISSASAYHKPVLSLPITESTPLHNPYWEYSRNKIACEELLTAAYRRGDMPMTIVRPSHTYDRTLLPFNDHYTTVARMRAGKAVVVHGDGTSLWTMTHHRDFAAGFNCILGNPQAVGETYHITSDEWLTWDQIYTIVAGAAGVPEPKLVHVPSDLIARIEPNLTGSLLGDKSHSVIFDNSKIRRLAPNFRPCIPFWQGAREVMAWFDSDPARRKLDPAADALHERLIAAVS